MHPDLMRKIDFYAGIPLTCLGTQLDKLARLFRRAPSRPQKILFVELSEMGSTILADPAMRKARDLFAAELYFVIFAKNRPSLRLLNTIPEANIFTIREEGLFSIAVDVLRFRRWCRRKQIDTVVDLELFSRFSALLSWLSGAPIRSGFFAFHSEGLYRGDFLTHKVAYNPYLHIAKNFIALVNALAATKPELPYSKSQISDEEIRLTAVTFSSGEKTAMRARIAQEFPDLPAPEDCGLVIINPNSSELLPQRRWAPENYVTLARMILAAAPTAQILITGSPSEREGSQLLVDQVNHPRCHNFTGYLRLEELPLLYAVADLMVTNDSGPGHFAAVTRMPTVVLFGPETPALYGSLGNFLPVYAGLACSPCVSATNHRKTPCRDNVCLQVITPEMVFAQLQPFLRTSAC
ncbi:MAG: glycosyltransferase family 9 protein [Desulfobulbaceae bacterium]|nr:glycosyltransferase family 9 protein [Desulfobulbaceae bacterium]